MPPPKKPTIAEAHDNGIILANREIFLHNHFEEEDPGLDYRAATKFLTNLRVLESASQQPITVHQYSTGGEWHAGMAIYDAIKGSPCSFIFICHGICASMGSVIAQSVLDKGVRVSMPNCDWLIHEGTTCIEGTYKQAFSGYEFEKEILSRSYDIYVEACEKTGDYFSGNKKRVVKNFLRKQLGIKEDWWINSGDAVYYGFADGIFGEESFESLEEIKKNIS